MAHNYRIPKMSTREWHDYIVENVRCDFETGILYWKKPWPGRQMHKPLGCLDTNGYVKVKIGGRSTYAHSVVYLLYHGVWPSMIDHDDHNRSNNRPDNLILTTHRENGQNTKMWATNTSGIKGVSITPYGSYKVNRNGKHLGTFKTAQEAEDAYNRYI